MRYKISVSLLLAAVVIMYASVAICAGNDRIRQNGIDTQWVIISGEDEDLLEDYDEDQSVVVVSDPIEGFNRAMFTFNDRFYFWIYRPVATGYRAVTPDFFREGVRNFFYNIMFPVRFVGSLLQGKVERAGQETCRFLVNTTVGLGGMMTPSDQYRWLNPPKEDVGQAMAKWGIGNGPYIVWPFVGASTLRDTVGFIADQFLYPFAYVNPGWVYFPVRVYHNFNDWSFDLDAYPELKKASVDPYEAVKDAYIQYRQKLIEK